MDELEEEDSDDTLSFVSATDSELETESLLKIRSEAIQRASSPACSIASQTSFRRATRKRPAPQPPEKGSSVHCHSPQQQHHLLSIEATQPPPMDPSQPYSKRRDDTSCDTTPPQLQPSATEFANQQLSALPSEEDRAMVSEAEPPYTTHGEAFNEEKVNDFSNVRLRMIDDVIEPLSRSLPPSSAPSTPSVSYQTLGNSSYSSSDFHPIRNAPTNDSPFYFASIRASPVSSFAPAVVSSTLDYPVIGSDAHYVSIVSPQVAAEAPPTLGQLHPFLFPGPCELRLATEEGPVRNPLSHSVSDPGIHRYVRNGSGAGLSLPPPGILSLDRLSETEEGDEGDNTNDGYYEEVFLRRDFPTPPLSPSRDGGSLPLNNIRRGRRRSERSDSIHVAHLYEDLIVSSRWNLKVTFTNLSVVLVVAAVFMPNFAAVFYNLFRLVFGTLFPAYYSYKAVRTKNVKEYVKWMMYWIVFAFFTCAETITDLFLSFWFPFYYEIKILVVLWLLSPATRGSSILYRKFVHPWLTKKEEEIDECIAKAKEQGYSTVVQLGTKGVNYATSVIMQTAIKGGGGLVSQLKRSYSASEITEEDVADHNSNVKILSPKKENQQHQSLSEEDDVSISSGSYESEPRHRSESESFPTRNRGHSTGRAMRTAKTRSADVSEIYVHDGPETLTQRRSPRTHDAGRTAESGSQQNITRRSRSGDVAYATLPRTTSKRTTVKKRQA